jgi:hypothetical protein
MLTVPNAAVKVIFPQVKSNISHLKPASLQCSSGIFSTGTIFGLYCMSLNGLPRCTRVSPCVVNPDPSNERTDPVPIRGRVANGGRIKMSPCHSIVSILQLNGNVVVTCQYPGLRQVRSTATR